MSKIGYARVSSKEQNLDRQLEALQSVSKVFSDKASRQSTERPQLQAMLDYLREGDIVVVPPHFSKFQIFFKNFPALPLGKIASNFKTMREFHSLKIP